MLRKAGAKRGRKPSKKIVQSLQQVQEQEEDDETEFILKMELIELVQGYPCIYDIPCDEHKKEGI